MSDKNCAICGKLLSDGTPQAVVKEKGLKSINEASHRRKDGKHIFFRRVSSIEVHDRCRKQYVRETCIVAASKRAEEGYIQSQELRSCKPKFDFKNNCFLCGVEIPQNYQAKQKKLAPASRNPVFVVRNLNVRANVLKLATRCNDEYCKAIIHRLQSSPDLVAADGQYHLNCMKKLHIRAPNQEVSRDRGRPKDEVDLQLQAVFNYLESSDEECQFTSEELLSLIESDNPPHWKTVRTRLIEKYGNDIFVTTHEPHVVCFKNTGYAILTDAWYTEQKNDSDKEERLRIVKTAAAIIVEDIRSQAYNLTQYPPTEQFIEGSDELIPETLKVFTDGVILKKKRGNFEKWKKKSTVIAHALITAAMPSSFVSPVQVGLAAVLYKKYGSRQLLDMLSALGLCSSYTEATRFEISSIMSPPLAVHGTRLSQMVYDNADFNVQTIDGHNTLHVMGGIVCISPKSAIIKGSSFPRLKNIPSAEEVAMKGAIEVKTFERTNDVGLAGIKIQDLSLIFPLACTVITPSIPDLLWIYGKHKELPDIRGWNGFMEEVTRNNPYQTTFVGCQPFINAPPGDINTIYTALVCATKNTKSLDQVSTIVTFDQPLYLKAREVLESRAGDPELCNVVLRLGGFHLLMSFMGAVGYIMEGSGLSELFHIVYAVNSTEKIMTGHAYARAVRAHFLAHTALVRIILQSTYISHEIHHKIEEILCSEDRSEILKAHESEIVQELSKRFAARIQELVLHGPTAKLWIQYLEMITLVKNFIGSERIGNWKLHLETIHNMMPYFHASGHFLYAKCAQLYLQDMDKLKNAMPLEEFNLFTSQGAFTIRRTDKLWSGTWSDMTIEQNLMKYMKSEGGLTRQRGVTPSILARWTQGMSSLQQVCEEIESYCGVNFSTSEQHVDSRDSRIKRDNDDMKKLMDWFEQHPPFPEIGELISISTGIVGDDRINCHLARELGTQGMNRIVGDDFRSVKFKRSNRVNPLSLMKCAINIHGQAVPINPTTLFQRMTIAKESEEELEEFLKYELSPYPSSLFDEIGLRKGTKSSLYKAFKPVDNIVLEKCTFVIDGGFLLHRVVWPIRVSFSGICDRYVSYVLSKYKTSAHIVFDGYSDCEKSTKYVERMRRSNKKHATELIFSDTMVPTVSQEKFLSNSKNKSRFIKMLISKFAEANIVCSQAHEDADRLIVVTASNLASKCYTVAVVGEDIDLLVIMVGLCTPSNVYFMKPGKGSTSNTIYHPPSTLDTVTANHILFVHAMSGCDTTSALYNQGKIKFIKTLRKNPDLEPAIDIFKDPQADLEAVVSGGAKFLLVLYGSGKNMSSLNKLRHQMFITSAFKVTSNIAILPSTEAAARQHTLRVYLQVQAWLGFIKDPLEFGWIKSIYGLQPITTLEPPAPDKLLRLISCKCKTDCKGHCGCRKAGLYCSRLCQQCQGNCNNIKRYCPDDDLDEVDVSKLKDEEPTPRPSQRINENSSQEFFRNEKEKQPRTSTAT